MSSTYNYVKIGDASSQYSALQYVGGFKGITGATGPTGPTGSSGGFTGPTGPTGSGYAVQSENFMVAGGQGTELGRFRDLLDREVFGLARGAELFGNG